MYTKKDILLRKVLHLGLLIPLGIFWYGFDSSDSAYMFLTSVLLVFFVYEYIRLDTRWQIIFDNLVKPQESERTVDGLNLLLATFVVHSFAPANIAMASMLMAIVGDTVSTIGGLYGTMEIQPGRHKSTWEGVIATVLINVLIGLVFLDHSYIVIAMALLATIIEIQVHKLDDNLVVPIIIAFIGLLISYV